MTLILFICFQIFLLLILICIFVELFLDFICGKVPYVPTAKKVLQNIFSQYEFQIQPKNIYDLGAGDARFLLIAEKQFPQANIIGYEYSLWPFFLGKLNIVFHRSKTKLIFTNFYKINLSQADLIFCFLGEKQMKLLEKKFKTELKKNTIIICNTFTLPNHQPIKEIILNNSKTRWHKIFIYKY